MNQLIEFITHHWMLCTAALAVLIMIIFHEIMAVKNQAKTLTPSAAVDAINHDNAAVFDIRDPEQYREGHIIDSILTPKDELTQPKWDKYKNRPVIIACNRGVQAATVAAELRHRGFQAIVLAGGITAWRAAGLPLVKGKS